MADQAVSKAVAIAEEYKGHIEAAGMEMWAARQVARDALAMLKETLLGQGEAFDRSEVLRGRINKLTYPSWSYSSDYELPGVARCADLDKIAREIGDIRSVISFRVVDGAEEHSFYEVFGDEDGQALVIGGRSFRDDGYMELRIPAEILDMTRDEVHVLYEEAALAATREIEAGDKARQSHMRATRERQRLCEEMNRIAPLLMEAAAKDGWKRHEMDGLERLFGLAMDGFEQREGGEPFGMGRPRLREELGE